jgi:hypothetical protein
MIDCQQRMAESTSPSLSRSLNKVEYASCIKTILPSPTSSPACHSSFDFLSQPRDCHRLLNIDQQSLSIPSPILEHELPRLNIDRKKKRLVRTESVSLPTTPTRQLSPSLLSSDHQYHRSIQGRTRTVDNRNNHNDAADAMAAVAAADDDDDDVQQQLSSPSSPDYVHTAFEQNLHQPLTDERMSNSKRYIERLSHRMLAIGPLTCFVSFLSSLILFFVAIF